MGSSFPMKYERGDWQEAIVLQETETDSTENRKSSLTQV